MNKHPINEFVIKVASRCNLNCDYCYEYNLGDLTWKSQPKLMSEETTRVLGARIAEHASHHALATVFISFHGGEVLLLGAARLDRVCQILLEQIASVTEVQFSMQTNATLLSERFVDVIRKHRIAVSISIDGNRTAHDRHRVDHRGRGSYDRVLRGIDLLKTQAPECLSGLLSVIDVLNEPLETFEAVASHGIEHIDFLLPHYHWDSPPPRPQGDQLAYGRWYWEIYRAWTADTYPGIEIRFLANIVSQLAGGISLYEQMTLSPVTLVVVATDGSIEAVDSIKSTASGRQQLGLNVYSTTFEEALDSKLVRVRQAGEAQLCKECRECRFKKECAGGYFPHRWGGGREFDNPSVYCADLLWLISQIQNDLTSRRRNRATLLDSPAD